LNARILQAKQEVIQVAKQATGAFPSSIQGDEKNRETTCDVLIAGGGYVGLCVGVALASEAPHLNVLIVDIAPEIANEKEKRASAVAAAAIRMLDKLGVWAEISGDAQPISEMIVTDSKVSDATRPVFLTFGEDRAEVDGNAEGGAEPFAHMVPNKTMIRALRKRAQKLGVKQTFATAVNGFERDSSGISATLSDNRTIRARLLVAADGVNSRMREQAGIKVVRWPYGQWGIVTTVRHERPHNGRAEEHFLPAGPFAILPLKGNRSSLVWTEREADAKRILAMDDISFELELEQRFGHHLGEIESEEGRKAFPLGLTLAREFVTERVALVGDAAHGIHPIAGQGLNLGFKDVAALVETIIDADRLGLDIGSVTVLERYQAWRRFDTVQMGVVTDVLNRLFSNNNPLLRIARDVGLGIVDRMPGLKKSFIEQAAGNKEGTPKLLRGESL
jgi:2-octaprenyl-6-methoxyphenol hydroxylase